MYKISVIPGDGVGPEVIAEGVRVLEAVGDLGVFFSDQIIKVVNRGVFLRLEEYVQNLLSLFAVQLPVSSKILSKYGFC